MSDHRRRDRFRDRFRSKMGKPTRQSSCDGKKRFTSNRAHHVARMISEEKSERMHAYPCRYCKRWHIGHNWEFR